VELTYKSFNIAEKLYLTNKLDFRTLSNVLDSNLSVVDGIYRLNNNVDSQIKLFNEENIDDYNLNACVDIHYAYAGPARAQVANVKSFRPLIKKRPYYNLRINLYKESHEKVFHFSQKYTRSNQLIDQIIVQKSILEDFINENIAETK
tara:strand:+ start:11045 stop:11488 length:444 start_codon:yes stop_codon:yes gene_type:complete